MVSPDLEQSRIHQQLSYEAALPYLNNPQPSGVDVENLLNFLSEVTRPTLSQARTILGAASTRVSSWVERTDSDSVIRALTPALDVQRAHVETAGDTERESFIQQSSKIQLV